MRSKVTVKAFTLAFGIYNEKTKNKKMRYTFTPDSERLRSDDLKIVLDSIHAKILAFKDKGLHEVVVHVQ